MVSSIMVPHFPALGSGCVKKRYCNINHSWKLHDLLCLMMLNYLDGFLGSTNVLMFVVIWAHNIVHVLSAIRALKDIPK